MCSLKRNKNLVDYLVAANKLKKGPSVGDQSHSLFQAEGHITCIRIWLFVICSIDYL